MSDEELDWDNDFDFGDAAELKPRQGDGGSAQVVLSGVAANPDEEENWDDDFDLDIQVGSAGKESTLLFDPKRIPLASSFRLCAFG